MNPLSLKALAVLGAGASIVILALLSWALWLRGDVAKAEGERDRARDQLSIVSTSLGRCTAQTDEFRRAGDNAVALSTRLAELARAQAAAGAPAIASLEKRLAAFAGSCDAAWASLENDYKTTRGPR